MADTHITICISDEGYYQKFFALSPVTSFKKVKEAYKSHICRKCSNHDILDFWFDAVQLKDADTPANLKMETGDVIDIRLTEQATRGACPVPPEQTLPNIHYLTEDPPALRPGRRTASNAATALSANLAYDPNSLFIPPFQPAGTAVRESQAVPTATNDRITLTIRDQADSSLTLRIKKTTAFKKVLDAYAKQANRDPKTCRLYLDGYRVGLEQTPAEVEAEEGDLVEVFWEQLGG